MHLYILTRGQKDKVDNMISDLQAQYFPYKTNPHTPPQPLQLGVRPIQLYELAFPKESMNTVIAMLQPIDRFKVKDSRWSMKILGFILKFKKLLGLQPIPEVPKDTPFPIIRRQWVDIKGVGIKDDKEVTIELV